MQTREKNGRFGRTKRFFRFIRNMFLVVAFFTLVGAVWADKVWMTWDYLKGMSYKAVASSTPSIIEKVSAYDGREAIRDREDVKRQQELIVEETFLAEEKEKVNAEKKEAVQKYEENIQEIEAKLEAVRAEKMSFQ